MANIKDELNDLFAIPPINELPPDVMGELESILRLHSISPQELSYKWESYTIKMGPETKLDLVTTRAFKTDIQELLEREARSKAHVRSVEKRVAHTPRNAGKNSDVFGMQVVEKLRWSWLLILVQDRWPCPKHSTSTVCEEHNKADDGV